MPCFNYSTFHGGLQEENGNSKKKCIEKKEPICYNGSVALGADLPDRGKCPWIAAFMGRTIRRKVLFGGSRPAILEAAEKP